MKNLKFLLGLYLSLITALCYSQDTLTINVDFGGTETAFGWNNTNNGRNGQLNNLSTATGQQTDIDLEITMPFNGTNMNGTQAADPELSFPSFATGDSFFGNTEEWNGAVFRASRVVISDLDNQKGYDIVFFASRLASDNRETAYTVTGGGADTTMLLSVSDNVSSTVKAKNVVPDADGNIYIDVTTGPNNNNAMGFYYLGLIRLMYEGIIEVVEPKLALKSPTGGEYYQAGKQPEIRWSSQGITELALSYSVDNGISWTNIDTVDASRQAYAWTIPAETSEECLVRIQADSLLLMSPSNFTMTNEDTTSCHIVVLGSSTAAGAGPTTVDSAWVWMYRDTLFQNDTRFTVTNLARGGFSTYNILPNESVIPAGVSQVIDSTRNVSMALSLKPDALIINLPSNDAANSYSVSDQLENYDGILSEPNAIDIPYWICTTQPRNNFSQTQKDIQTEMRDSTFEIFGAFSVDFWSELADDDSNIDDRYNSGDGVHLNNAGHRILLDRILSKGIDAYLLEGKEPSSVISVLNFDRLSVYPNPSSGTITIKDVNPPYELTVFDSKGQKVMFNSSARSHVVELPIAGMQYLIVRKADQVFATWVYRM